MQLSSAGGKVTWTPQAETILKKVPFFIVSFVRKAAEDEAVRRGLPEIGSEFLQELAARRSPHRRTEDFGPGELFAKKSAQPLYDSFAQSTLTNEHGAKLVNALPDRQYQQIWQVAAGTTPAHSGPAMLYIHIPFCATRCRYCGFFVNGSNPADLRNYTRYLLRELDMMLDAAALANRRLSAVYLGGGTPSDLDAASLSRILQKVNEFNLADDCEVTLEGRISSLTPEKIAVSRQLGVNRFSLGVQSFDTALRRSMGRISSRDEVIAALRYLQSDPGAAVVIDQIYGFPGQTMPMWEADVKTLLAECPVAGVDHYPLIQMPGTLLDRAINDNKISDLPTAADRADMFCRALDILGAAGARRISLKHFAFRKIERNCYNRLQAYGADCLAAGCGAGGTLEGHFFYQGGSVKDYCAALDRGEKPLSLVRPIAPDDRFANRLSGDVLTQLGFSLPELQQTVCGAVDLAALFEPLLRQYEDCNLLTRHDDGRVNLTRAGQFWHNAITQNFNTLYRHGRNGSKRSV